MPPAPSILDDLLAGINSNFGFPALVAAVTDSRQILAVGATGVAIWGQPERVTSYSRFHLGSITKSITATAIATLVEEGVLSWNTRPADTFPELDGEFHPAFRDVELRHLLAHRAGIASFEDDREVEALHITSGTPRDQRVEFAQDILCHAPAATPLADYLYSNGGYGVAAAMAERAADVTWESLVHERLFLPLYLESAGTGWPALAHPHEPWGHYKRGNETIPHPPDDAYRLHAAIAPAGDVHMNVLDLMRYAQLHLQGLAGRNTLLRADTVRTLHTPFGDYSLGWNETGRTSQHSGSAGTFSAALVLMPGEDRAYAFLTNACEDPPGDDTPAETALASEVLNAIRTLRI